MREPVQRPSLRQLTYCHHCRREYGIPFIFETHVSNVHPDSLLDKSFRRAAEERAARLRNDLGRMRGAKQLSLFGDRFNGRS